MEETSIELQSEAMSIVSEIVLTILDDNLWHITTRTSNAF